MTSESYSTERAIQQLIEEERCLAKHLRTLTDKELEREFLKWKEINDKQVPYSESVDGPFILLRPSMRRLQLIRAEMKIRKDQPHTQIVKLNRKILEHQKSENKS